MKEDKTCKTPTMTHNDRVPFPHWMRALEEKYQRLHLKIAYSTTPKAPRYNRDGKLIRPPSKNKKNYARALSERPHKNDSSETLDNIIEPPDNSRNESNGRIEPVCVDENNNNERVQRSLTDDAIQNLQTSRSYVDPNYLQTADALFTNVKTKPPSVRTNSKTRPFMTANSRISMQTTQSWPVVTHRSSNSNIDSIRNRRIKTADVSTSRSKFKPMSSDAVTIIKDMVSFDSDPVGNRERGCDIKQSTIRIETDYDENVYSVASLNSYDKITDVKDVRITSGSSKLPDIESRQMEATLNNLRQIQCRVPGIGKYDITVDDNEAQFEITPPGYDVRYTNAVQKEQGEEDEIPCEEVKAQAVDKCSAWLTRYNFKTRPHNVT